jgi:hypothetical protein
MKKVFTIAILLAALLTITTGTAFAQETTPLTGTVQLVEIQPTDPITGETVVAVTLLDETTGTTQIVNISLETAETLGLVTTDIATGVSTVDEGLYDTEITIDPLDILPDPTTEEDTEAEHPVGSALGEFFGELLGVDYDTIMTAREEYGAGFGVIAQALWLTNQIDGGAPEFEALLEAKQSGNYEDIVLADGSTPDNWGDVVKSLKQGENLGSVKSGHADSGAADANTTTEAETETDAQPKVNGQGNGNSENNGNGNSQGGNNNQGNNNGQGNKNDNKDKDNNGKGDENGKGNGKGNP